MSDQPHDDFTENDNLVDTARGGVTRRELFQIGNVLALPVLLGSARAAAAGPMTVLEAATGPLTPGPQIYRSIGVEPVINCRGTFTIIGGVGGTARSAGRNGRRRAAVRAARRAGRSGRPGASRN